MTTQAEHLWHKIQRRDQEIAALRAERDQLRAFCQAVFETYPEGSPDGFEMHDLAVEHGLLAGVEVTEPCGEDGACYCEEYDDFPQTCYRRTELLTGKESRP